MTGAIQLRRGVFPEHALDPLLAKLAHDLRGAAWLVTGALDTAAVRDEKAELGVRKVQIARRGAARVIRWAELATKVAEARRGELALLPQRGSVAALAERAAAAAALLSGKAPGVEIIGEPAEAPLDEPLLVLLLSELLVLGDNPALQVDGTTLRLLGAARPGPEPWTASNDLRASFAHALLADALDALGASLQVEPQQLTLRFSSG